MRSMPLLKIVQNEITKANGHNHADFEEFWKLCPKKVGKPVALNKWIRITSEKGMQTATLDKDSGTFVWIELQATPAEIIEGMRRYAKKQIDPLTYKLKDDGRFVLHPATWLNRGGWMDG